MYFCYAPGSDKLLLGLGKAENRRAFKNESLDDDTTFYGVVQNMPGT